MKHFIVTLPTMTSLLMQGRETTEVEADYFRVQEGVLTFRREQTKRERRCCNTDYPVAVRVFAPGFWAEVAEKRTLNERLAEYREVNHVRCPHGFEDLDNCPDCCH